MIDLLNRTVKHQCFDPRNRLFALRGIATDPNALPYPADYRKDTSAVYMDFAVHHVKRSRQLILLAYSRLGRAKINDMASWVPDWSAARNLAFHRPPVLDIRSLYCAGGRDSAIQQQSSLLEGTRRYPALVCKGAVVDRIEILWPGPPQPVSGKSLFPCPAGKEITEYIGHTLEQILLFLARYSAHKIPWSVLWRTLLGDKSLSGGDPLRATKADEQLVATAIDIYIWNWQERQRLQKHWQRNTNTEPEFGNLGKPLRDFQRVQAPPIFENKLTEVFRAGAAGFNRMLWADVNGVGQRLRRRLATQPESRSEKMTASSLVFVARLGTLFDSSKHSMSICVTSSDRLGWVPDVALCGDVVAILPLEVPLILRPCEEASYKVVGESYVHGIMDGEAIKGRKVFDKIRLV